MKQKTLAEIAAIFLLFAATPTWAKESGFTKSAWTAHNCHLTTEDFHLLDNLRSSIPVGAEPKANAADLIAKVEANPRISSCQLTLAPETREYINNVRNSRNPVAGTASLLEVIGLSNTAYNGTLYETVPPEVASRADGNFPVYFPLKEILENVKQGVAEAVNKNAPLVKEITLDKQKTVETGHPETYRIFSTVITKSSTAKSASAWIDPKERENFLFPDEVLDTFSPENKMQSTRSMRRPALDFKMGASDREKSIEKSIASCMTGFKPSAVTKKNKLRNQIAAYFNRHCIENSDEMMVFVPDEAFSLPKADWRQVSGTKIEVKKNTTDDSGEPSDGLLYKGFLELAGLPTDFDGVLEGTLQVGKRDSFEKTVLAALKLHFPKASDKELEKKKKALLEELVKMSSEAPNGSDEAMEKRQKKWLKSGGLEILLSLMSEDFDQMSMKLAYRKKGNEFQLINLVSTATKVDELAKILNEGALSAEAREQMEMYRKKIGSCVSQTRVFSEYMDDFSESEPNTAAEAEAMIQKAGNVTKIALASIKEPCRTALALQMAAKIAEAKEILQAHRKPTVSAGAKKDHAPAATSAR